MSELCERYRAWLLGSPEAEAGALPVELSTHLEGCPECRGELAWLDTLETHLVAEEPRQAPEGLDAAILARLQAEAAWWAQVEGALQEPVRAPEGLGEAIMTRVRAERSPGRAWIRLGASLAALLLISAFLGLAVTHALPLIGLDSLQAAPRELAVSLPELDSETYRQPPVLPSLDWLPDAWPSWRWGPIWPLALLLGLLCLGSNLWLVRQSGVRA